MYKFYYSYRDEIYGVLEYNKDEGMLLVELIRKGEHEEVTSDWLAEHIADGVVDIAHNVDHLNLYKDKINT